MLIVGFIETCLNTFISLIKTGRGVHQYLDQHDVVGVCGKARKCGEGGQIYENEMNFSFLPADKLIYSGCGQVYLAVLRAVELEPVALFTNVSLKELIQHHTS